MKVNQINQSLLHTLHWERLRCRKEQVRPHDPPRGSAAPAAADNLKSINSISLFESQTIDYNEIISILTIPTYG